MADKLRNTRRVLLGFKYYRHPGAEENNDGDWWVVETLDGRSHVNCSSESAAKKIITLADATVKNEPLPFQHKVLERKAVFLADSMTNKKATDN